MHDAYPDWDDNRLFNVARLINAAVMAKIHSIEWTPAILPNPALDVGLNVNWYGLLTFVLHKGKARKTLSEINVRNAELGGIVGNPIDKHGCAFGLTEEFVEVYRLHSLLPETLQLRRRGKDRHRGGGAVSRDAPAWLGHASRQRHAMSDLFYSFGNQHPGAAGAQQLPALHAGAQHPGQSVLRHGHGRYRARARTRRAALQRVPPPARAESDPHASTTSPTTAKSVQELKSVYGDDPEDVEKLDLLIGTLAEGAPAHRLRFRRDDVPDLHPQRQPPAAG